MLFIYLFILLWLPFAAASEGYVADAFGLSLQGPAQDRGGWSGLRASQNVQPQDPDQVLILLGPKSLVAGKDRAHATALVFDRHGNLVADGTPVTITVEGRATETVTRDGIADHLFKPTPKAREIMAGVTVGTRQSARAMIRVVADIGSIAPSAPIGPTDIAGESFFDLKTGPLMDRFGNRAEDGTALTFGLTAKDLSTSLATAIALDGKGEARMLSRDIAGTFEVKATLASQTSPLSELTLDKPRSLSLPAVVIQPKPTIGSLQLSIGPFLTHEGHFLPDGAPILVKARMRDGGRIEETLWLRDGNISLLLPISERDELSALHLTSALGEMELISAGGKPTVRGMGQ